MSDSKNKLLIFTKSPILGEVKTRLQPDYTPEQSLLVHKNLLFKTLEMITGLEGVVVELCCAPDRNTTFFLDCEKDFPIRLSNQEGQDLGERMAFSLSVALQTYDKVLVIGTDCPNMNQDYIEKAFDALNHHDAVIGPAEDGGYVLLGLKTYSHELFSNFSWGTDTVLSQTRKVLQELSWTHQELDIMHDVDRADDLRRYPDLLSKVN